MEDNDLQIEDVDLGEIDENQNLNRLIDKVNNYLYEKFDIDIKI